MPRRRSRRLAPIECRNMGCTSRAAYRVEELRVAGTGYGSTKELWSGNFCLHHLIAAMTLKMADMPREHYMEVWRN